jgi:hypothetical protein
LREVFNARNVYAVTAETTAQAMAVFARQSAAKRKAIR